MKSKPSKILALLMAMAIVFSLAACGKDKDPVNTTTPTESVSAGTTADETAAESATTVINGTTTAVAGTTSISSGTTAVPVNTVPTTKAEILTAYTAVMDKAKTEKPAYKKLEFQALPKDMQHMEGAIIGAILPVGESFMDKEEDAKVEDNAKGSGMGWFPVPKSPKGCLLTNANAIKTAKCEELANGNYIITIVLNDEMNPEPFKEGEAKATSNTGNMFNPLARSEIDDTILNDSTVNKIVKNVSFDLKYYNCTAILEYNPKTSQIVKLEQYMSVLIDIHSGKVLLVLNAIGTAVLNNSMKCWDFSY